MLELTLFIYAGQSKEMQPFDTQHLVCAAITARKRLEHLREKAGLSASSPAIKKCLLAIALIGQHS